MTVRIISVLISCYFEFDFFLFSLVFLAKVGPADDKALMADLMEGESKPHSGTSAHTDNDKEYKPKAKNLFEEQEAILENSANQNATNSANQQPANQIAAPGDQSTSVKSLPQPPPLTPAPVQTPVERPKPAVAQQEQSKPAVTQPGEPDGQPQVPIPIQVPFQSWPSSADLNKRFRMIIAAYQRIFRRAQVRAQRMNKNRVQRQITERWTKREESDFYRAVSTFGTEMASTGQFKWDRFRLVAKLDKKSDVSLTNYYIAFRAMCERTCRRTTIPDEDLPAVYVEQISEDRASRTLFRIQLLDRIRRECLVHANLEKRLKLCQNSPDLPVWWIPGKHDKELLMGMHRHGLSRCEIHILNDPDLTFGVCMQAAQKSPPRIRIKSTEKDSENSEKKADIEKSEKSPEGEKSEKSPKPVEKSPDEKPVENGTSEAMETDEKKESKNKNDETSIPEDPNTPIIEVATEAEKQMLEAEFIQQQTLNRWPKGLCSILNLKKFYIS